MAPSPLPSVDQVLKDEGGLELSARFGRSATVAAARKALAGRRIGTVFPASIDAVLEDMADILERDFAPSQRAVFNLTGTVLHTNLGRAPIPAVAARAAAEAMSGATNLEFYLEDGRRGERDDHVSAALCELTGAEAATVVNNNAAAVMLVLSACAAGREVVISRGELVEIGGSFRIPDIMACSGALMKEVGTTNRTHPRDYIAALRPETGAVMRVHQSNYAISGFTAAVPTNMLAEMSKRAGVPFVVDLGSGSLVDLAAYGLPHEPTVRETLHAGADLVTFSGDKLLGGPQAGLIAGKKELIQAINKHPMKRAMRLDKGRLAALEAVLRLYRRPESLRLELTSLRLLTRSVESIEATAGRLLGPLRSALPSHCVAVQPCRSQIGSGALPEDVLPSAALIVRGKSLNSIAGLFRRLPRPVIGRVAQDAFWLDCRCLEDAEEGAFLAQLSSLGTSVD